MSEKIWKPIEMQGNVVTHAINQYGEVKVLAHTVMRENGRMLPVSEKILKPFQTTQGYLAVDLPSGKSKGIHRLVAKAFLPKPEGAEVINHKDCNVANNHVTNLEWVTQKENRKHAMDNGLIVKVGKCKPVAQYTLDGKYIETYRSVLDAHSITGVNKRSIASCANGVRNKAGNFKWVYV